MFDPVKLKTSLIPSRQAVLDAESHHLSSTTSGAELTGLASVITALGSIINGGRTEPRTPTRGISNEDPFSSPPVPTGSPTKLVEFLKYAEKSLGVPKAMDYEFALAKDNIGPDTLAAIPINELVSEYHILRGDAIRLTSASAAWWRQSGKRRREQSPTPSNPKNRRMVRAEDDQAQASTIMPANSEPWVRYEYRYRTPDSGSISWPGKILRRGIQTEYQSRMSYYDNTMNQLLPIPAGFVPGSPIEPLDLNDPIRGEDNWPVEVDKYGWPVNKASTRDAERQ
jgi:hypothetical protein